VHLYRHGPVETLAPARARGPRGRGIISSGDTSSPAAADSLAAVNGWFGGQVPGT
jgi:hypothetical protein